ncbi:GntR family transcriptional regulator [Amycolatopsis sp. NPDC026612]|uniref:GntR family transcriptional regulator n=1 Tax=Amycolatopsis sp. NPDC026612 TaxID=3155466 RepID=UPI0033F0E82E
MGGRVAGVETSAKVDGAAPGAAGTALRKLRALVVTGELKPGDQIRQDEMAARLGVSRVPLREALRVLSTEGLLTHRLHQGYFVADLSTDEFRQIVALLEFLETELIRTARWPTNEEIAQLREINARLSTTALLSDPAASNEANRLFHFAVFQLSPLKVFVAEAERYWALAEPLRLLHVVTTAEEEISDQHEQLIDALAAQDRALCIRVLNEHRRATLAAALNAVSRRDEQVTEQRSAG